MKRLNLLKQLRRIKQLGDIRTFATLVAAIQVFCCAQLFAQPLAKQVTVNEAGNFALALSPEGDRLALSVYNMLYLLPAAGGKSEPITDMTFDVIRPAWSPKGDQIAVQSFADGRYHIWLVSADTKERTQLTRGPFKDSFPTWSPDGSHIAFSSDRYGAADNIWTINPSSGELKQLTSGAGAKTQPAWSPDGKRIAYIQAAGGFGFGPANPKVQVIDLASGEISTLIPEGNGAIAAISWSPDGRHLAFQSGSQAKLFDVASGEIRVASEYDDVFPFPAVWLDADKMLYGANGKIVKTSLTGNQSAEIPFEITFALNGKAYKRKSYDLTSTKAQPVRGIADPVLSPNGRQVAFKALNDIWLLGLDETEPKKLTDDGFYESDPAWSRDGRYLAYTSDKGGSPDIYLLDLQTKSERRLTSAPGAEFAAALSADGQLAYQNEAYQTSVVALEGGEPKSLGGGGIFSTPGKPSWSADGKTLAVAVQSGGRNQISLVDVTSGKAQVVEPAPFKTLTSRGDEGPVWSPDGQWLAFTMEATLWVLPVNPKGEPVGPARQLTDEVADSPSWNGDSTQLLYLSNGKLKLVDIDGESHREVALDLTWRNDVAETNYIIHAGKVWDGVSPEIQKDMDIVVRGARISSIKPHSERAHQRGNYEFIDASGLTVIPGLIDMHYHQQVESKILGDRQGRLFLSFGITTTRSPGDNAYRGLEDRESLASGARIGPRYFMSGDILDGLESSWEFARSVVSEKQLDLELGRMRALDYDMAKTYSTFPHHWQKKVIDWAHEEMGVPVSSHFLYPSSGFGGDGVEHIQGGPVRNGFNHVSRDHERHYTMYEDMFQLFAKSGITGSTTIFAAAYQYGEHPELLEDPRVRAFYPPADQEALVGRVKCATGEQRCGAFFVPSKPDAEVLTATVKRIIDMGGSIVAGTDAPLDEPALSLHNNLRGMAAFDLTNFETFQLTTLKAAQVLNLGDDLGSIERGKLADLVFLDGDPSQDIADLANVKAVMKGGRHYSLDELLGPFAR